MKKKIKLISIITIALLIFGMVLSFTGCVNEEQQLENARNRIQEITNIEVPSNSKIIYHHKDNVFVNGRRAQLTAFEFEKEPTDWLKENNFLSSNDETVAEDGYHTLVEENKQYFEDCFGFMTIDENTIPNIFKPNFNDIYLWTRNSRVFFFYYPNKMILIVFIAGS